MTKICKTIVFDFDGVISPGGENLKNTAWDQLALRLTCPRHTTSAKWQAALSLARNELGSGNGKGSRYNIIAHALTVTGLPATETDTIVSKWADAYNDIVQKMILETGIYPETQQALKALCTAGHHLYVNTATPTLGVVESLTKLDLLPFFVEIYGQPTSKVENMNIIAAREHVRPEELLFVGDSEGDIATAQHVSCTFIGVTNDSNNWVDKPFPLITRLDQLLTFF